MKEIVEPETGDVIALTEGGAYTRLPDLHNVCVAYCGDGIWQIGWEGIEGIADFVPEMNFTWYEKHSAWVRC